MSYCTKCGAQLPDDANFCLKCGAKTKCENPGKVSAPTPKKGTKKKKPVYKRWWFWTIIAIFVIAMFSGEDEPSAEDNASADNESIVSGDTEQEEQNLIGSENNPYVLNAEEWYAAHCAGEPQTKYLDKWVKVSGTVLTVSDVGGLKGYYLTGGSGSGLVCWVYGDKLEAQYGQCIEYIGKVTVEDSKHIEISDGKILSAEWPEVKPKSPVTISDWSWTRDYVGGVEWNFKITNNTDKQIKYVSIEWNCYNAVGDIIYDEITGKSSHGVKYTGPLDAGKTTDLMRNTTLFYNHAFSSVKFTKLQVEFMDGTVIRITNQGYADIIAE